MEVTEITMFDLQKAQRLGYTYEVYKLKELYKLWCVALKEFLSCEKEKELFYAGEVEKIAEEFRLYADLILWDKI